MELEDILTYLLTDPVLSEDRGASSPQASTTEASSLAPISLAHRCTRHSGISARGALLHSEIPLPAQARSPNLTFLMNINQQNIRHDRKDSSLLLVTCNGSSEVPLKYPLNPMLTPSFVGSITP